MRIGSLFSGYGGLDMGVQSVLGGEVAWHVEYDKAPSAILAHHWPDVPNYGDVTAVDFTQLEPVDILTGGYPCQPFSHAGKRKGTDDVRHLWPHVLRAIRDLGPRLVVLENVRGHLTLGFDTVLADLASVGWSAEWGLVRASDAGACHQRARLFIVAYPGSGSLAWPAEQHDGLRLAGERGGGAAADASGQRHGRGQDAGVVGRVGPASDVVGRQARAAREIAGDRGSADVADATRAERRGQEPEYLGSAIGSAAELGERTRINWGDYRPAIARWERTIGRPAPAPTEPGRTGQPRLSPAFVEWMMGLPAGHVTDPAIGISRNDQLKALGNGVVPQQAALALSLLLPRVAEVAA